MAYRGQKDEKDFLSLSDGDWLSYKAQDKAFS
jgi:hypothetical protein